MKKTRKKRSIIWRAPDDEFKFIVENSSSLCQMLRSLNLPTNGGYFRTLQRRISEDNLNISHIRLGFGSNKGRKFTKNVGFDKQSITAKKLTIMQEQDNKCLFCGQGIIWNGKKLILQLDHIDGNKRNNARSNLRILCPNCHSQTITHGNKKRIKGNSDKFPSSITGSTMDFESKNVGSNPASGAKLFIGAEY